MEYESERMHLVDQSDQRILFNVQETPNDENDRPQTPIATHRGISRKGQKKQLLGKERPTRFQNYSTLNSTEEQIEHQLRNNYAIEPMAIVDM